MSVETNEQFSRHTEIPANATPLYSEAGSDNIIGYVQDAVQLLPESQLGNNDQATLGHNHYGEALKRHTDGEYIRRNLNQLRIATQIRELALQGVTLKNTFNHMNEVWLELMTEDKQCIIVEQTATKLKYQLVNLYAVKLVKYLSSIVGLDLVPLAQQDPSTRTWKMDAVILNIASNKVKDHEDLYRLMLVNLFGLNEEIINLSFDFTWENIRQYIRKVYDIDLGDTDGITETPDLDRIEGTIHNWLNGEPLLFY